MPLSRCLQRPLAVLLATAITAGPFPIGVFAEGPPRQDNPTPPQTGQPDNPQNPSRPQQPAQAPTAAQSVDAYLSASDPDKVYARLLPGTAEERAAARRRLEGLIDEIGRRLDQGRHPHADKLNLLLNNLLDAHKTLAEAEPQTGPQAAPGDGEPGATGDSRERRPPEEDENAVDADGLAGVVAQRGVELRAGMPMAADLEAAAGEVGGPGALTRALGGLQPGGQDSLWTTTRREPAGEQPTGGRGGVDPLVVDLTAPRRRGWQGAEAPQSGAGADAGQRVLFRPRSMPGTHTDLRIAVPGPAGATGPSARLTLTLSPSAQSARPAPPSARVQELMRRIEDPDGSPASSRIAMRELANHGARAEAAAPSLARALASRDPATAEEAAKALAAIGKKAVPVLLQSIRSRDAQVRDYALMAASRMGGDGAPLLIEAMRGAVEDPAMAGIAAQMLRDLVPRMRNDLPGLMEYLLKTQRPGFVDYEAVSILAPALLEGLSSPNPLTREYAARVLQPFYGLSPRAIAGALASQDPLVRSQAVNLLLRNVSFPIRLSPFDRDLLSARFDPLGTLQGPRVRDRGLQQLLGQVVDSRRETPTLADPLLAATPRGGARLPLLLAGAESPRGTAVRAARWLGADVDPALRDKALSILFDQRASGALTPSLVSVLSHPPAVPDAGAGPRTLPASAPLSPTALANAAKSSDARVRAWAARTVGSATAGTDQARRAQDDLAPFLTDRDPAVRDAALESLGRLGVRTDSRLLDALAPLLRDGDSAVRDAAFAVLPRLGAAGTPLLTGLLDDPAGRLRALQAMRTADYANAGDAEAAARALAPLLRSSDAQIREAAADALARLGAMAMPQLAEAVSDPATRQTAAAVIARIRGGAQTANIPGADGARAGRLSAAYGHISTTILGMIENAPDRNTPELIAARRDPGDPRNRELLRQHEAAVARWQEETRALREALTGDGGSFRALEALWDGTRNPGRAESAERARAAALVRLLGAMRTQETDLTALAPSLRRHLTGNIRGFQGADPQQAVDSLGMLGRAIVGNAETREQGQARLMAAVVAMDQVSRNPGMGAAELEAYLRRHLSPNRDLPMSRERIGQLVAAIRASGLNLGAGSERDVEAGLARFFDNPANAELVAELFKGTEAQGTLAQWTSDRRQGRDGGGRQSFTSLLGTLRGTLAAASAPGAERMLYVRHHSMNQALYEYLRSPDAPAADREAGARFLELYERHLKDKPVEALGGVPLDAQRSITDAARPLLTSLPQYRAAQAVQDTNRELAMVLQVLHAGSRDLLSGANAPDPAALARRAEKQGVLNELIGAMHGGLPEKDPAAWNEMLRAVLADYYGPRFVQATHAQPDAFLARVQAALRDVGRADFGSHLLGAPSGGVSLSRLFRDLNAPLLLDPDGKPRLFITSGFLAELPSLLARHGEDNLGQAQLLRLRAWQGDGVPGSAEFQGSLRGRMQESSREYVQYADALRAAQEQLSPSGAGRDAPEPQLGQELLQAFRQVRQLARTSPDDPRVARFRTYLQEQGASLRERGRLLAEASSDGLSRDLQSGRESVRQAAQERAARALRAMGVTVYDDDALRAVQDPAGLNRGVTDPAQRQRNQAVLDNLLTRYNIRPDDPRLAEKLQRAFMQDLQSVGAALPAHQNRLLLLTTSDQTRDMYRQLGEAVARAMPDARARAAATIDGWLSARDLSPGDRDERLALFRAYGITGDPSSPAAAAALRDAILRDMAPPASPAAATAALPNAGPGPAAVAAAAAQAEAARRQARLAAVHASLGRALQTDPYGQLLALRDALGRNIDATEGLDRVMQASARTPLGRDRQALVGQLSSLRSSTYQVIRGDEVRDKTTVSRWLYDGQDGTVTRVRSYSSASGQVDGPTRQLSRPETVISLVLGEDGRPVTMALPAHIQRDVLLFHGAGSRPLSDVGTGAESIDGRYFETISARAVPSPQDPSRMVEAWFDSRGQMVFGERQPDGSINFFRWNTRHNEQGRRVEAGRMWVRDGRDVYSGPDGQEAPHPMRRLNLVQVRLVNPFQGTQENYALELFSARAGDMVLSGNGDTSVRAPGRYFSQSGTGASFELFDGTDPRRRSTANDPSLRLSRVHADQLVVMRYRRSTGDDEGTCHEVDYASGEFTRSQGRTAQRFSLNADYSGLSDRRRIVFSQWDPARGRMVDTHEVTEEERSRPMDRRSREIVDPASMRWQDRARYLGSVDTRFLRVRFLDTQIASAFGIDMRTQDFRPPTGPDGRPLVSFSATYELKLPGRDNEFRTDRSGAREGIDGVLRDHILGSRGGVTTQTNLPVEMGVANISGERLSRPQWVAVANEVERHLGRLGTEEDRSVTEQVARADPGLVRHIPGYSLITTGQDAVETGRQMRDDVAGLVRRLRGTPDERVLGGHSIAGRLADMTAFYDGARAPGGNLSITGVSFNFRRGDIQRNGNRVSYDSGVFSAAISARDNRTGMTYGTTHNFQHFWLPNQTTLDYNGTTRGRDYDPARQLDLATKRNNILAMVRRFVGDQRDVLAELDDQGLPVAFMGQLRGRSGQRLNSRGELESVWTGGEDSVSYHRVGMSDPGQQARTRWQRFSRQSANLFRNFSIDGREVDSLLVGETTSMWNASRLNGEAAANDELNSNWGRDNPRLAAVRAGVKMGLHSLYDPVNVLMTVALPWAKLGLTALSALKTYTTIAKVARALTAVLVVAEKAWKAELIASTALGAIKTGWGLAANNTQMIQSGTSQLTSAGLTLGASWGLGKLGLIPTPPARNAEQSTQQVPRTEGGPRAEPPPRGGESTATPPSAGGNAPRTEAVPRAEGAPRGEGAPRTEGPPRMEGAPRGEGGYQSPPREAPSMPSPMPYRAGGGAPSASPSGGALSGMDSGRSTLDSGMRGLQTAGRGPAAQEAPRGAGGHEMPRVSLPEAKAPSAPDTAGKPGGTDFFSLHGGAKPDAQGPPASHGVLATLGASLARLMPGERPSGQAPGAEAAGRPQVPAVPGGAPVDRAQASRGGAGEPAVRGRPAEASVTEPPRVEPVRAVEAQRPQQPAAAEPTAPPRIGGPSAAQGVEFRPFEMRPAERQPSRPAEPQVAGGFGERAAGGSRGGSVGRDFAQLAGPARVEPAAPTPTRSARPFESAPAPQGSAAAPQGGRGAGGPATRLAPEAAPRVETRVAPPVEPPKPGPLTRLGMRLEAAGERMARPDPFSSDTRLGRVGNFLHSRNPWTLFITQKAVQTVPTADGGTATVLKNRGGGVSRFLLDLGDALIGPRTPAPAAVPPRVESRVAELGADQQGRGPSGRDLLTLQEYRGLLERQAGGQTLDLADVPRPAIAGPDGRSILQGAGRYEKLRAGESMTLLIPDGAPLPPGAQVLQTGVSGEIAAAANLLSSRGSAGSNPLIVEQITQGKTFTLVRAARESLEAPTSRLAHDARRLEGQIAQWAQTQPPETRARWQGFLESPAVRDLPLAERAPLPGELQGRAPRAGTPSREVQQSIFELSQGSDGRMPKLDARTAEVFRALSPDAPVTVRVADVRGEQTMTVREALTLARDPGVGGLSVSEVPSPNRAAAAPAALAKFEGGWLGQLSSEHDSAIFDVTVRFASGELGRFHGNRAMLLDLAAKPEVAAVLRGEAPRWLRPVSEIPMEHRRPGFDPVRTLADQLPPEVFGSLRGSDLAGMTVHHGTLNLFEASVREGPQNVGKGFGGRGLYVAVSGERSLARFFADWAKDEAPARIAGNPELARQGAPRAVVLDGTISPERDLRVGRFTISRDGPLDLKKGVLPANWDSDPRLRTLLESRFDVLDLRGMRRNGLAIDTDRMLVFHESAGRDAIRWRPAEVSGGAPAAQPPAQGGAAPPGAEARLSDLFGRLLGRRSAPPEVEAASAGLEGRRPANAPLSHQEVLQRFNGVDPAQVQGPTLGGVSGHAKQVNLGGEEWAVKSWYGDTPESLAGARARAQNEVFFRNLIREFFPEFKTTEAFSYERVLPKKAGTEVVVVSRMADARLDPVRFFSLTDAQRAQLAALASVFGLSDINYGNILFGSGRPVLIDFEAAGRTEPVRLSPELGAIMRRNGWAPFVDRARTASAEPYLQERARWEGLLGDPAVVQRLRALMTGAGLTPAEAARYLAAAQENVRADVFTRNLDAVRVTGAESGGRAPARPAEAPRAPAGEWAAVSGGPQRVPEGGALLELGGRRGVGLEIMTRAEYARRYPQLADRLADPAVEHVIVNPERPSQFKGLRMGETVDIGREKPGRFDLPRTVSSRHLRVTRGADGISVEDRGSTNGTRMREAQPAGQEGRLQDLAGRLRRGLGLGPRAEDPQVAALKDAEAARLVFVDEVLRLWLTDTDPKSAALRSELEAVIGRRAVSELVARLQAGDLPSRLPRSSSESRLVDGTFAVHVHDGGAADILFNYETLRGTPGLLQIALSLHERVHNSLLSTGSRGEIAAVEAEVMVFDLFMRELRQRGLRPDLRPDKPGEPPYVPSKYEQQMHELADMIRRGDGSHIDLIREAYDARHGRGYTEGDPYDALRVERARAEREARLLQAMRLVEDGRAPRLVDLVRRDAGSVRDLKPGQLMPSDLEHYAGNASGLASARRIEESLRARQAGVARMEARLGASGLSLAGAQAQGRAAESLASLLSLAGVRLPAVEYLGGGSAGVAFSFQRPGEEPFAVKVGRNPLGSRRSEAFLGEAETIASVHREYSRSPVPNFEVMKPVHAEFSFKERAAIRDAAVRHGVPADVAWHLVDNGLLVTTELVRGETMKQFFQRGASLTAADRQVIQRGLDRLNSAGWVATDISIGNLMVREVPGQGRVFTLIDTGGMAYHGVGTPEYRNALQTQARYLKLATEP